MEGACGFCGKPAQTPCQDCREGVDFDGNPSPTVYCDKICQTAHSSLHKANCNSTNLRKQLYRAGKLAQGVHLDLRRIHFDNAIGRVEHDGRTIHVYERPFQGAEYSLVEFPEELFGIEDDKRAMLTWWTCDDTVRKLSELIQAALSEAYATLEEVTVLVDPSRQRIVFHKLASSDDAPAEIRHVLFRVRLKDGTIWAFDLAGSQYGHSRTVTPWETYLAEMVTEEIVQGPFGASRANQERSDEWLFADYTGERRSPSSLVRQMEMVLAWFSRTLKADLKLWMEANGDDLGSILRSSNEACREQTSRLSHTLRKGAEELAAWLKDRRNFDKLVRCGSKAYLAEAKSSGKEDSDVAKILEKLEHRSDQPAFEDDSDDTSEDEDEDEDSDAGEFDAESYVNWTKPLPHRWE